MDKNTANDFENLLYSKSKGLKFLANLEKLIPNQKLTMEDFETLTEGNDEIVESILSFDSHNYGYGEFFEKIVVGKGILHLRSLAIQLVSDELYTFHDQVFLDKDLFDWLISLSYILKNSERLKTMPIFLDYSLICLLPVKKQENYCRLNLVILMTQEEWPNSLQTSFWNMVFHHL